MAYILNIHTATEKAIVNIAENDKVLAALSNDDMMSHSSFLHAAINYLSKENNISINDIAAIAVTIGPGSYTGIRIGLAAASGLSYSLKIPIITFSSLQLMAASAINLKKESNALYCPMIDARRMEVYTSVYDNKLNELVQPLAVILQQETFADLLNKYKIYFFGSGAGKFKNIVHVLNANFISCDISQESFAKLSFNKFLKNNFNKPADVEPLYLKSFNATS